MEAILNFEGDLDIDLLDRVVKTFMSPGPDQIKAENILKQFQDHPDAWRRVDSILEKSTNPSAKFIALKILEDLIKTRWKILPREQCDGIKNFIVNIIIKSTSDDITLRKEKTIIYKLDMVLVQILKQEWPHNWPSFIPEIVASSKSNLSLCENNMVILKLLSEEIFDFSAEQMTQSKTKNLKSRMCNEFSEIFQLCYEVLDKAQKPSLINATLETLLKFLNWIPLGYIFETNLIDILKNRFLEVPMFRNITIQCLTEIGGLQVGPEYNDKFILLFNMVMGSVVNMIPLATNLKEVYANGDENDSQFIQNLALFLTSFLGAHLKIVEQRADRNALLAAHRYLVLISQVEDREIFKICLEYWAKLVADLYDEIQSLPDIQRAADPLILGSPSLPSASILANIPLRKHIYVEILSSLRVTMIECMVKPEEVLIVENDEGEIVRETMKESDTIVLYKSMREVLVYLTHLDVEDTEQIMSEKLARQVDGSQWSWDNLNKLCWAIGSISGAMSEETEKRFLVTVIKELLGLCEMKKGKDNKAVVASNIMYTVGQYPRFLKAHWKFLKTVVNKLFEFMHELHEGVQDMACDTFIKIAQKCKRHFVLQQPGEIMPYIEEILNTIESITSDLQPSQVHTFYEAVGYMISAQTNKPVQERLIAKFMELPNRAWATLMEQAKQNLEVLNVPENIKVLANILKTNVAACVSIGPAYYSQLTVIYMDLLSLYRYVSQLVSQEVAANGRVAISMPKVRSMRTVKKESLKLIETYVTKAEDLNNIAEHMIPPLLAAVLTDYAQNVEDARDAEVLSVMATVVTRIGNLITDRVPEILQNVFECTLNMINKDFEVYPDHRVAFFKLLRAINIYCFPALLKLQGPQFKLFLDSIVWAFKHTMRDIAEMGLGICSELLSNFTKAEPAIANAFFQAYFLNLLQDIFFVLTDTSHKNGFKLQAIILAQMFCLADSGGITAPLYDPSTVPNPNLSNEEFLKEFVVNLLRTAFPHLQHGQLINFVQGLFQLDKDLPAFKSHLRDFLISLKEFSDTEDTSSLYIDEREAEIEKKKKADMDAALRIPGMVKPHDRPDDGMVD